LIPDQNISRVLIAKTAVAIQIIQSSSRREDEAYNMSVKQGIEEYRCLKSNTKVDFNVEYLKDYIIGKKKSSWRDPPIRHR
jgi:hypothetical protein